MKKHGEEVRVNLENNVVKACFVCVGMKGKSLLLVIPAQAGIQQKQTLLGPRLRGDDG